MKRSGWLVFAVLTTALFATALLRGERSARSDAVPSVTIQPIDDPAPPPGAPPEEDCLAKAGICQSKCTATYQTCTNKCGQDIGCWESCGNDLKQCNDVCVKPCEPPAPPPPPSK